MKAYRVAEARAQFGSLLDEAEMGGTVLIERNGVRFVLEAEPPTPPKTKRSGSIEYVHPDVAAGDWTWSGDARGLRFRARRRRQ